MPDDTAVDSHLELREWLLLASERGNDDSAIDQGHGGDEAWSRGNRVRPIIHGRPYFAELHERISAMGEGDLVYFVDWRGDPEEQLTDDPESTVVATLSAAAQRGVAVRGLLWRAHWRHIGLHSHKAAYLNESLAEVGAEALRDMRVRRHGSHHQKFVVLRHADDPTKDIAYVGGIDLCRSRRDDARHLGDPQPIEGMPPEYGPFPAWHDAACAITGPAVFDVETCFRERWEDSLPLTLHPLRQLSSRLRGESLAPSSLPPQAAPPPSPLTSDGASAPHTVQILRTYPAMTPGFDFAPNGERSIARGYAKALSQAKRFIYIEDQYLWSEEVARDFVLALQASPELQIVAVLPLIPDMRGAITGPPNVIGREDAISAIIAAGGDRVAFYGLENEASLPIYVHSKVCIVDGVWATIGSDNFNRRSWTSDSELTCAVIDESNQGPSGYALSLRRELSTEHLGLAPDDERVDDPGALFELMREQAEALDAWHTGGRSGVRPVGRLRSLPREHFTAWQRTWAPRLYNTLYDPDARNTKQRQSDDRF